MDIEKKRAFIIRFLYGLTWIMLCYILIKRVLPLVSPFLLALGITWLLIRPTLLLSEHSRIPYRFSAVLVLIVFYGSVGALICLLGVKLASAFGNCVGNLPGLYATYVEPWLMDILESAKRLLMQADASLLGNSESISGQMINGAGEMVSQFSVRAVGWISNLAVALPELLIELMLTVIATFFLVLDYEKLRDFCLCKLGKKPKELLSRVKGYITGTLFRCLRACLLILAITFIELSVGLTIIGVEKPVLVAALIAVFDILPVLGTGGIMLPWTGICFLQGRYDLAIGLAAVYLAITVIRNIIEPRIVGEQLGLHPLVTLVSMYVGVRLVGFIGLFGGPILLSLLQNLYLDRSCERKKAG